MPATRFYFPASGTPAVSPTVSSGWLHANTLKRPLTLPKGSTTLSSTSAPYSPDAADHLGVDGDSLIVQYVSDPLPAQTMAAQTVKLAQIAREVHANNNLVMSWKIFLWTAAGAIGPIVLPLRRDDLELGTSNTSRFDSATTTAVAVGVGDRLVVELGVGGNPGPDTTGNQNHSGAYRFGESGTTDAPEADGSVSLTENPWIEFADDLFNPVASGPATTAVVRMRSMARLAVTGTAFVPPTERRAVVTWAAFLVPFFTLEIHASAVHMVASVRVSMVARKTQRTSIRVVATAFFQVPESVAGHTSQLVVALAVAFTESAGTHDSLAGSGAALVMAETASEAFTERFGEGFMLTTAETPLIGVHGALGVIVLWSDLSVELTTTSMHPPLGPFDPLEKINLGQAYRGDTLILPLWEARDQRGVVIDLTGADIWFTAKTNLDDTDLETPTIQCTLDGGGIEVLDPVGGVYRVTIQPYQTQPLDDDTVFWFDVQIIIDRPQTQTVRTGWLTIVRDVTRAMA